MRYFPLTIVFVFFRFWFYEAPKEQLSYFASVNHAFLQLFSLSLLIKTFFKPVKNEYRDGLVGFSIGMGMFLKSIFIPITLFFFFILLGFELLFMLAFFSSPVVAVLLFFSLL